MNPTHAPTALIAEDEPLLAAALQAELAKLWPELRIVARVGDGDSAVAQSLAHKPDVLFLDIRMPGQSGIEAAAALADAWDTQGADAAPFPAVVFVTAYDQYAIKAFEAQAVDYLLKPVQPERLKKSVSKLQFWLVQRAQAATNLIAKAPTHDVQLEATLAQLRQLLGSVPTLAPGQPPSASPVESLQVIQASVGATIHLVPVQEVLCFEAADKYVRVLTAEREYLIRTPLKELQAQLDAQVFWQIHRGTVVRAQAIESVSRDEAGKTTLQVRGLKEKFGVSRLYGHLFKAM